jgi:hypothetical protein
MGGRHGSWRRNEEKMGEPSDGNLRGSKRKCRVERGLIVSSAGEHGIEEVASGGGFDAT